MAQPALCARHTMRPGSRPAGRGSSFGEWSARQRCLDGGPRVVVLRGLAERVQLEVLYALQRAAETGRRTRPGVVQGAVNIVRAQGVSSISGLSMEGVKRGAPRLFLTFAADQVTLALSTRAGERPGTTGISGCSATFRVAALQPDQPGLAEGDGQAWAAERIDTVRPPGFCRRPCGRCGPSRSPSPAPPRRRRQPAPGVPL